MKKLLCMILALIMVLSLCACGQEKPNNENNHTNQNGENNTGASQETTLPAAPTEEEQKMLQEYVKTVGQLNEASSRGSYAEYQELYPKLLEMEGVEKWAGSEHATWAYNAARNGNSCVESFNVEKDWDRQAVLARFAIVKNTYLGHTVTVEDHLGNTKPTEYANTRNYWPDGNVRELKVYQDTNSFLKDSIYGWKKVTESDINSSLFEVFRAFYMEGEREYDEEGHVIKITEKSGDAVSVLYEVSYNADGTMNKIVKKTNKEQIEYSFSYENGGKFVTVTSTVDVNSNTSNKTVVEYTYNDAGQLVKEEMKIYVRGYKKTWEQAELDELGIMEYAYDADGKLATGTYTYQDNVGNKPYITVKNQYTFQTNAEGRVTQVVEIPGDRETWNNSGTLTGTQKADNAKITYDLHYGDFYIYTPTE